MSKSAKGPAGQTKRASHLIGYISGLARACSSLIVNAILRLRPGPSLSQPRATGRAPERYHTS